MSNDLVTVPATLPVSELLTRFFQGGGQRRHQGYPVVDDQGHLYRGHYPVEPAGRVGDAFVDGWLGTDGAAGADPGLRLDRAKPITAFPWESCRAAASRMAQTGLGRLVVVLG